MEAAVWAAAAGLSVWLWLNDLPWWLVAAGWVLGLLAMDPAMMIAGMAEGLGATHFIRAQAYGRARDLDEQKALLFLVRLQQLLNVKGTLSTALDDMGYRAAWGGGDAAERVLEDVARRYRVRALDFVSRVALTIRRHGGALIPLVSWAADTIQQGQSQRQARKIEDAARHTTIVVLAAAPIGIIAVFRLVIPSFYQALSRTVIGNGAILLIGGITCGVLVLLARQTWKEADVR